MTLLIANGSTKCDVNLWDTWWGWSLTSPSDQADMRKQECGDGQPGFVTSSRTDHDGSGLLPHHLQTLACTKGKKGRLETQGDDKRCRMCGRAAKGVSRAYSTQGNSFLLEEVWRPKTQCSKFSRSWLAHSVCLLVCGWYPEDRLEVVPKARQKAFQTFETHAGSGGLQSDPEGNLEKGTLCTALERLSTISS